MAGEQGSHCSVKQLRGPARWAMLALGWAALALAALGAVLPLLPTTPFVLVAAWAFGRSNERLRRWLYDSRWFGPLLRNWEQYGAIPRWAKALAVGAMAATFTGMVTGQVVQDWVLALVGISLAAVSVWIVTRPSGPPHR
jgi:uncharacterized protein